jgi:hypothetical protein
MLRQWTYVIILGVKLIDIGIHGIVVAIGIEVHQKGYLRVITIQPTCY